jgi:hypothetical protein
MGLRSYDASIQHNPSSDENIPEHPITTDNNHHID